jgi:hypothetical protein
MGLLLQLLGGVLAATLVVVVLGERPSRVVMARAIGVIAIGVLAVAGLASLWPSAKGQLQSRSVERKLSPAQKDLQGATVAGVNTAFVEWLAGTIGPRETFALANNNPTALQWISYRLQPRWLADSPQHADWLIFYGSNPKAAGYRSADLTDVRTFQPDFSIARQRSSTR